MYQPSKEPWAHQRTALQKMEGRSAFALLMAMRTGKTKVILDDFGRLEDEGLCDSLLVIAPAGVYRTWLKAIDDHVGEQLAKRLVVDIWQSGKKRSNTEIKRPAILLVNVEALSSVDKARQLCLQFLTEGKAMLVIDESTTIKNISAKRTKFIVQKLAPLAKYRRIMSGLPTPQSPLDLYSQFDFLDGDILNYSNYYAFRARYAIMKQMSFGGRQVPIVVGFRDVDKLQKKIEPHSYRVTLEDCYDLPPKIYQIREVLLTQEQHRIYNEIKTYATATLASQDHVTATQVITQILRMHQVLCGHVVDEEGNMHIIPENRTASLIELLSDYDGKAIIWCSYNVDVHKVSNAIKDEFGENSFARFWGGNLGTREEEEFKFLNSSSCRFMVATPAAGGRGRTWTCADMLVYYSNTNNLEHRSQSEERGQGIDKIKSTLYVDLVTPGTVDIKILKALKAKINMAATINGDNYREWLI